MADIRAHYSTRRNSPDGMAREFVWHWFCSLHIDERNKESLGLRLFRPPALTRLDLLLGLLHAVGTQGVPRQRERKWPMKGTRSLLLSCLSHPSTISQDDPWSNITDWEADTHSVLEILGLRLLAGKSTKQLLKTKQRSKEANRPGTSK